MTLLLLLVILILAVLGIPQVRRKYLTEPLFTWFKQQLPPLSKTEQEALEAGSVWWDGELFTGKPNWEHLHNYPKPCLSPEEQSFIDVQVPSLIQLLDDYAIVQQQKDLPEVVWSYLKTQGFFALIIPKKYGGRAFSAFANSTIVSMIATRSVSAAITVMVPNSLGPAELLLHYGTAWQKQHWLPALASGKQVPCFALTGPEAGSDAGSIPDTGIVCKGEYQGKEILGIRLSWNKRYITLAPVATVLGLAFKLYDPHHLLGETNTLGITCALIPTAHPGVKTGDRHLPLGLAFMNGPTCGTDVFIPIDWIIGGPEYAGKGWRMLVECLSAGRGISLPALGTAVGHMCTRSTSAYAYVRQQFGLPIGKFEGVEEALARMAALTYQLEATRRLTTTALDLGERPAVITAIAKYHMSEMARMILNDAMDIHGGRAIQLGGMNYLGNAYNGIPVSITVEGANILTRNLIIFGQGASRCHPYVLTELQAAAHPNQERGLELFEGVLLQHLTYSARNIFSSLFQGLTFGRFNVSPVTGETARYYRQLSRLSQALAVAADVSMLIIGGELKRKERLSARLGDVLSHLYLASATLKHYEDQGRQVADLPLVAYAVERNLHLGGEAFKAFYQNFPHRVGAKILQFIAFPFGVYYPLSKDVVAKQISTQLLQPSAVRERLCALAVVCGGEGDAMGVVEQAFLALHAVAPLHQILRQAQREGTLPAKLNIVDLSEQAMDKGLLSSEQVKAILDADRLRQKAIQVDSFTQAELSPQVST